MGFNFFLFQRNHSQLLLIILGKDQSVFHTFIHNKFSLREIPAVSLFVSVISCLEMFFQFAPQKRFTWNTLLESYCWASLRFIIIIIYIYKIIIIIFFFLADVFVYLEVPCWNGNGPHSYCFSGNRFFCNLQISELIILKNGLNVRFCMLTGFYVIELGVTFLTYRNSVWFFPFGSMLKKAMFQTKEWNILWTGHIQVMQATLHNNVSALKWKSRYHPENPFHFTLHWGNRAANADP